MTAFLDEKGREVFVAPVTWEDGSTRFCSVRAPKGGLHKRVKYIPSARSREQALVNLRKFGEREGWKRKIS